MGKKLAEDETPMRVAKRTLDHTDRCRECRAEIPVYTEHRFRICHRCAALRFTAALLFQPRRRSVTQ